MAKILYSLSQEGRGHSSRAYEVIRRLAAKKHEIIVLTGGDSYEPLQEALKSKNNVRLVRLPGLRFAYDQRGRVSYAMTISKNARLVLNSRKVIRDIEELMDQEHFDLAISDFEPFAPRAARNKGVRFITLDNQHRFVFGKEDLRRVSPGHALSYFLTKQIIKGIHPLGEACIITSAFPPRLDYKKFVGKVEVHVVGPIIRSEVEALKKKVKKEDFILVYVKPALERAIIPKLQLINEDFVMYVKTPENHPPRKNISYKKLSISEFAKDMSKCKAVISSAGEQIMSEALFLGKPLFLLPEGGTYEQKINGELVKHAGVGDSKDLARVGSDDLSDFIASIDVYGERIKKLKLRNGTPEVMRIIFEILKKA